MPKIETDSEHYTNIANAIREMTGTQDTYYPADMAQAIRSIPQEVIEEDYFAPIIYSLEEREVGVFTDGKPLYQKTYVFNGLVQLNSNSWYDTGITLSESLKPIKFEGHAYWNDNAAFVISGSTNNNKISLIQFRNTAIQIDSFTMYYTKVSDTPGSGTWGTDGVPMVHYDGNEKIIGTWFGETLYQKSYIFNNYALVAGQNLIDLPILRDIDVIVNSVIVMSNSAHTNFRTLNLYDLYGNHTNSLYYVLHKQVAESSLQYKLEIFTSASWATPNIYVTLQYTKSS